MNRIAYAASEDHAICVGCGGPDEGLVDGGWEDEFESSWVSRRGECAWYLEHACHSYGIRIGDRDYPVAAWSGGCRGRCYRLRAFQILKEVDQI